MRPHIRANFILLVLSLLLCSVLYPLALLGVGQALFPDQAEGSLIRDKDGTIIGSRLIAQPFTGDEYFQPRPSAAGYNGAASGASNWGASNPLLRDRVAQTLGPMVKYAAGPRQGQRAGEDVARWFQEQAKDDAQAPVEKRFLPRWANDHTGVAEQWIKNNADAVAAWLGIDVDSVKDHSSDLVKSFFTAYAAKHPGTWPSVSDKKIKPARHGADVEANLFDSWLQTHAGAAAQLERVPADLVMASGSGLDPHITLKNAEYQLERVAEKWAKKQLGEPDEEALKKDEAKWRTYQSSLEAAKAKVKQETQALLREKAAAVWGGTIRVPIVNVLEVNLALRERFIPR